MANKLEEMNRYVRSGWDFVYLGEAKRSNVGIINSIFPDMIRLKLPKSLNRGGEMLDVESFYIDLMNALKQKVAEGKRKFILFDNFNQSSDMNRITEIMTERTFDSIPISDNVVFGVYGSAEEFGYKGEVIGGKQFFARLVNQINQKNQMDRD